VLLDGLMAKSRDDRFASADDLLASRPARHEPGEERPCEAHDDPLALLIASCSVALRINGADDHRRQQPPRCCRGYTGI
jgi:hypothetical protein